MTRRKRPAAPKSVETRYYEERERLLRGLAHLDRRTFLKVSLAAAGAAATAGVRFHPHSFQVVDVANAAEPEKGFRFANISDSHLYERKINERFVRALLRAVDDTNLLDPQPDFVLYGGDLAQLHAGRG